MVEDDEDDNLKFEETKSENKCFIREVERVVTGDEAKALYEENGQLFGLTLMRKK